MLNKKKDFEKQLLDMKYIYLITYPIYFTKNILSGTKFTHN
jgi:hypothetical protein